ISIELRPGRNPQTQMVPRFRASWEARRRLFLDFGKVLKCGTNRAPESARKSIAYVCRGRDNGERSQAGNLGALWATGLGDRPSDLSPPSGTCEGEPFWVGGNEGCTQRATVPTATTISLQVFVLEGLTAQFANGDQEKPPFLTAGISGAAS